MSTARYYRRNPETVSRETSARDAAGRMVDENVGCLVVIDDARRPVGIVTDRDVVLRGLQRRRDLDQTSVGSIMSPVVGKAREDTPLKTATVRMAAEGVRRLPVIDSHGRLAGILTYDDALQYVSRHLSAATESIRAQAPEGEPVTESDAHTWEVALARHYGQVPVRVRSDTAIAEVADEMLEYGVGCIVVVDDGNAPIGVITDRDLLRRVIAGGLVAEQTTAEEIMSTDAVTAAEDASLGEVLDKMKQRSIRRLPLVDDKGELTGVVALDDIIAQLQAELSDLASCVRLEMRESGRLARDRRLD